MKQSIKIFTKLESFKYAQNEVKALVTDIFEEEIRKGQMTVESYSETESSEKGSSNGSDCTHGDNVTETVFVVLDARQTRVLITPRRKDPAVDHWDELRRLSDVTNPKGSIMVIIYGDETSKDLKDDVIIDDKWNRVFQFNDEHSPYSLLNGRCFSMWQKFTEHQKKTLQNYMHTIALFPSMEEVGNVLVVGNSDQLESFRQYIGRHPFLHVRNGDHQDMKVDELFVPSYVEAATGPPLVRLYHCNTVNDEPIKLCDREHEALQDQGFYEDNDMWEKMGEWLMLRSAGRLVEEQTYIIVNKLVKIVWHYLSSIYKHLYNIQVALGYALPMFDRVILISHDCDSCFKEIYENKEWVDGCTRQCLEYRNIHTTSRLDILPVAVEKTPKSMEEKRIMVKIMKNFIMEDPRKSFGDMATLLGKHKDDDDWIQKMYVLYLCHAGFQNVDHDEVFEILDETVNEEPLLQPSTATPAMIKRAVEEAIGDDDSSARDIPE